MGLIDRLEYRLLRKLCPSNRRMDGSAYAGKSKLRELMGNEITTRIRGDRAGFRLRNWR